MNDSSDIPRALPAFAHMFQSFAGPLVPTTTATVLQPVSPDVLPGPPRRVHAFQFFAGPLTPAPAPAVPIRPIFPDVLPGPSRRAYAYQFFAGPTRNIVGNFPGSGSAGAATFILSLEPGAKVTYSWGTDIFKSYSGREQRISTTGTRPRQRFDGNAWLADGPSRDLRSTLQRAASSGSTFLLALPYEELTVTADSVGTTVTVQSTAACDWAIVTQRVAVIDVDESVTTAVIQAVTSTTIRLDVIPGVAAGARIMPLVQVLLDPSQGFSRYPVSVELWSIKAMANVFGWVGQDRTGVGAQIVTYASGLVDASALTDDDLPIWDRPNAVEGTSAESMLSLTELVDLGALPFAAGVAPVPDWARPIKYSSADPADWQWLKAFLRQLRGRQRAFLLSTNHADLIFVSVPTTRQLKVASASTSGAGDYTSWWTSLAHRSLAITKSDGSVQYVSVISAPVDNDDGTLTLALDATVTGTVSRISMAELVRIDNNDSDNIPVTWDGGVYSIDLLARTTEEAIATHGYPATATQMATACRAGTWTAGWLCEDSGSPLTAAFGGTSLPEVSGSGSPVYGVPGPIGDKAVRITVAGTGFEAASTSFLDVDATEDLCGAVVMRSALPLSTTTYIVSKSDFVGGPGYSLTMSSTTISITTDHATPGNVTASATVPDTVLTNNEWFVVMFAMERGTNTMRVALKSLSSGVSSIGTSQSISSIGSLNNASAAFRINRGGTLGNTLEVAALYMGVGVGVATGLPASLGTALSNFVAYLGA